MLARSSWKDFNLMRYTGILEAYAIIYGKIFPLESADKLGNMSSRIQDTTCSASRLVLLDPI